MDDIEDLPFTSHEVISASLRTDIPACYMRWMIKAIRAGFVMVPNPLYKSIKYHVNLDPQIVKVIAWWSKNYKMWIREWNKEKSPLRWYDVHYFNFTINGESELENLHVSFSEIKEQLYFLVGEFGVDALNVRFDPIVHWEDTDGVEHDNLEYFEDVVELLEECGIEDLTFSFCVAHAKTKRLMKTRGKLLVELSPAEKKSILKKLVVICEDHDVVLKSCCEDKLVGTGIVQSAACIDANKIDRLLEEKGLGLGSKAKGRRRKECNCVKHRDIGDYESQPCGNSCDYCYANPKKLATDST